MIGLPEAIRVVWTEDRFSAMCGEPVRLTIMDKVSADEFSAVIGLCPRDRQPPSESEPWYSWAQVVFPDARQRFVEDAEKARRDFAHAVDDAVELAVDEYRRVHDLK